MNLRHLLWALPAIVSIVTACNYTDGPCYRRGEGEVGGVGGSVIGGPVGVGGYGDTPPPDELPPEMCNAPPEKEQPENPGGTSCGETGVSSLAGAETYAYCAGPCEDKCPPGGVAGFSTTAFTFTTLIPDDGKDEGGGWQVAAVKLSFWRWTGIWPENWSCPFTIGMPLRTALLGPISPSKAAQTSAAIATEVTFELMRAKPELPPGIFCSTLITTMNSRFKVKHKGLGAMVTP
jgi:hypothetical protein